MIIEVELTVESADNIVVERLLDTLNSDYLVREHREAIQIVLEYFGEYGEEE